MCGITVSISILQSLDKVDDHHHEPSSSSTPITTTDSVFNSLREISQRRGPDSSGTYSQIVKLSAGYVKVTISVSVLGLRGVLTPQPIITNRRVLAWNGQAFRGLDVSTAKGNDTRSLAHRLEAGESIEDVLSNVEGPFAFVSFDFETKEIIFAVDPLSRRSLLLHTSDRQVVLTSATSREARQSRLDMRVLGGGELGLLRLNQLEIDDQGRLNLRRSIEFGKQASLWPWERINVGRDGSASFDPTTFITNLSASVQRRVENIPRTEHGARVAVLFSGGVDCTLLACLIHRFLPINEPIELVNVAFGYGHENFDVPDRLSARLAADELRQACEHRTFHLVEIDINYQESMAHRQAIIDLMYPCDSEMDLSLAFPLYFASRGIGRIQTKDGWKNHHVQSKVYISGLGADEQLGGYGRHRKAFERGGHQSLADELQLDLTRLPTRNLARDDRMLSSHARDARYPYLDLEFVSYVSALPVSSKCDFGMPPGKGDKRLLRLAAAQLNLPVSAERVKRAMQFGTRSAKLGPGVAKGHPASAQVIQS